MFFKISVIYPYASGRPEFTSQAFVYYKVSISNVNNLENILYFFVLFSYNTKDGLLYPLQEKLYSFINGN